MKKIWLGIAVSLCFLFSLNAQAEDLPLNKLKLPPGFSVHIYAKVPNARSMTLAPNGIIFVGTRTGGQVYAVLPGKTWTKAGKVLTIAQGLEMPNGVAYHNGNLYVAEMQRVIVFKNILKHVPQAPYDVIMDTLPNKTHHGWRYIKFGPDNWLYIAIGAPCNVCIRPLPFATIARMRPDGSDFQIYAKGVRNSVGFAWQPGSRQLWFTDNGRDWLGDNIPPDELNYAPKAGMNFGFPYYYGDNVPDPIYGKMRSKKGMTIPAQLLGPHVAALGMIFYTGKMFPAQYHNNILIAQHGSWNRSQKIGYRLMMVKVAGNRAIAKQPFVVGWLQGQNVWGRPVDLLQLPDGSLLVSDDYAGVIYRIVYKR